MRLYKKLAFAFLSSLLLLSACGNENPAPEGSSITINPASKTWNTTADPGCTYIAYEDLPVAITVRDKDGKPLNDIDLTLSLDLSTGVTSGGAVMDLYDGTVLVTSPYGTKTDGSGTKTVMVRMWYGCDLAYKGQLNVYSGSAYAGADFEVTTN